MIKKKKLSLNPKPELKLSNAKSDFFVFKSVLNILVAKSALIDTTIKRHMSAINRY